MFKRACFCIAVLSLFAAPQSLRAGLFVMGDSYTVFSTVPGQSTVEKPTFSQSLMEAVVEGTENEDVAVTLRRALRKSRPEISPVIVDKLRRELSILTPEVQKNALVIGTDSTFGGTDAVRDARFMNAILRGMGFKTTLVVNPDAAELKAAIAAFLPEKQSKDMALVYYSGNGIQLAGEDYLQPFFPEDAQIPKTAEAWKETSVQFQALQDDVLKSYSRGVFIVDAGRPSADLATPTR